MIQSLDSSGTGLRVAFYRPDHSQDRWGHVIGVVRNAETPEETVFRALPSLEGIARDGWPVSPPLQNLSIEQQDRGPVALAVGMANQCHWSASIEAIPNERRLIFDIACRVNGHADALLRSCYLDQQRGVDSVRISFGQELQIKQQSGSLALEVKSASTPTVRWKYTIDLH